MTLGNLLTETPVLTAVMARNEYTLVTGASSGIGRETAICLSQTRSLILHGRDEVRLRETRATCHDSGNHHLWQADLADVPQTAVSLHDLLTNLSGSIEAFVHCAGKGAIASIRAIDYATATDIMNINAMSALEIVRVLLRKASNRGALKNIVFVSSVASLHGVKGYSAYAASKGALDSLMRSLAVELAPDVRVNSVLPGGIHTPMTASLFSDPDIAARMNLGTLLGPGCTSDVANIIEFLLSDRSRWITGQQLVVDGGQTSRLSL